MRFVTALAFVPPEKVMDAFEALSETNSFLPGTESVQYYFEDNWFGRPQRRRQDPRFPIEIWNCYSTAIANLPKSNNYVEGWHRDFESTVDGVHVNIF